MPSFNNNQERKIDKLIKTLGVDLGFTGREIAEILWLSLKRRELMLAQDKSKPQTKIDDKEKYDSTSQLKTLVVMQVLGNSKSFFESQQQLNDRAEFFTDTTLPDAVISDNSIAGYFLFVGSDGLMNEIIESQY